MSESLDSSEFEERNDHPTPAGGVYSIARFTDHEGKPCPRSQAVHVTFSEYDQNDQIIATTSGSIPRS